MSESHEKGYQKHYSASALGRSLRHFVIGKGFKIVSSVTLLILLGRYLSQSEYAAYVAFQGLVLIAGLISSFGIESVLARYIPELRSSKNDRYAFQLLLYGVLARFGVLVLLVPLGLMASASLGEQFGFSQWLWLLPFYLSVGVFRLTALTISQALESFLWQRAAQYSLAAGNVFRLFATLIVLAISFKNPDYLQFGLQWVVAIELTSEILTLLMLMTAGWNRYCIDTERDQGEAHWWRDNRRRLLRFGGWSWMVSLAAIFYGSGPNRLLAARFMPEAGLATFGYADNATNLARRIMPTRLLIGLIRPIFISRFAVDKDFSRLADMTNLVFRLNLLLFCMPIALLVVVGPALFDWLTAGKYPTAAPLLAGFLVLLSLEGLRMLIDVLVQAMEKNEFTLIGNVFQSISFFVAIALFPLFGIWALVISAITGTTLAIFVTKWLLSRHDAIVKLDWKLIFMLVAQTGVAIFTGIALRETTDSNILAGIVTIASLIALLGFAIPFKKAEIESMASLLPDSIGTRIGALMAKS